ncbi:MAG: pyroglutamyl-peptidase I [Xanthobacteraceae bacterium]
MRVVLAGFGPFPGAPVNPSGVLAKALVHSRRPALAGLRRTATVFATSYAAVDRGLPKLFAEKPDIVLVFGLAGRRRHVCIETRARNAVSVLFPDASRHRPPQSVIKPGGSQALTSHAPFAQLVGAVRARKVPVRPSRDAGRYLCNYIYWRALERAPHGSPLVQFVHIPAVSLKPQRKRRGSHRSLSFADVMRAGESLLIALAAASRR